LFTLGCSSVEYIRSRYQCFTFHYLCYSPISIKYLGPLVPRCIYLSLVRKNSAGPRPLWSPFKATVSASAFGSDSLIGQPPFKMHRID
jgi:hypothetical protein